MESGLESAGAMAMAGAAARAIDPPAAREAVHGGVCANCGAALAGAYCSACGQQAHLHRSVLHAFEEVLHGITHFDSKLWNTLPLLAVRPGKLTRDYVHGRRARYVAPVALFLLTVFAMFLLFGFLPAPKLANKAIEVDPAVRAELLADMQAKVAAQDARIAAAEAALAPGDKAALDALASLKADRAVLEAARRRVERGTAETLPADIAAAVGDIGRDGGISFKSDDPALDAKVTRALQEPDFLIYKMKQKGYKLSFLLVPLSLPWMMLLFAWKRGVHVYDHVVFLLYSISFMSMLAMVAVLLAAYTRVPGWVYPTLLIYIPVLHMFAQLKEGYALGWGSAAWRTVALAGFAVLSLIVYLVVILLLGLLD
jgi:hypothetical protein